MLAIIPQRRQTLEIFAFGYTAVWVCVGVCGCVSVTVGRQIHTWGFASMGTDSQWKCCWVWHQLITAPRTQSSCCRHMGDKEWGVAAFLYTGRAADGRWATPPHPSSLPSLSLPPSPCSALPADGPCSHTMADRIKVTGFFFCCSHCCG